MRDAPIFWMVYGAGQGRPTYQHSNEHAARQEAQRLARLNPGVTFTVLEAKAGFRKDPDPITEIQYADYPF